MILLRELEDPRASNIQHPPSLLAITDAEAAVGVIIQPNSLDHWRNKLSNPGIQCMLK